jgi:hypothetical protein
MELMKDAYPAMEPQVNDLSGAIKEVEENFKDPREK